MSTLFTFGQKRISLFFLFFSAPKTRASATELPIDASAYKFARLTLGHDLITPEEIMRTYRGVVYTEAQLDGFKNSVPSEEVILWCRDNGFLLIAGPTKPLSFLEIGDLNHSCTTINERFAHDDKVGIGWLMMDCSFLKSATF